MWLTRNPAQYRKKYGATPDGFAAFAREMMAHFRSCTSAHAVRDCALAFEALSMANEDVFFHADQLIKSMYSAFMGDWLAAYPRDDLLVLRLEEYVAQRRPTLERVFRHLMLQARAAPRRPRRWARQPAEVGMCPPAQDPTEEKWSEILSMPVQRNGAGAAAERPPIAPELRTELYQFYEPFNAELARQLGDDAYRWPEPAGR